MVVVKNTLLEKALMTIEGVDYSPLFVSLKGTTAVMFSEVANAPAKLLKEYKDGNPTLKAAYAEEGIYVGADQLEALANIKMVVVKNTLLEKALMTIEGVDYSPLFVSLKGTTAVMFSEVANAPAKLLKEYKDGVPSLKAAYAEEGIYVGADQLEALANIKSKNEVIADIVALLQSPAKNVISALQSGGNTIHGVLKTLGERAE
jgi:large subunit ribosomal protein L10